MTRVPATLPRCLLVLSVMCLSFVGMSWSADDKDQSDIAKRIDASAKVLTEIMATPDKAIPDKVLWLIVDAAGRPRDLRVVRGLGFGLDEKALEAVRQWRFQPAMKDGRPVDVQISVEVDFHLY